MGTEIEKLQELLKEDPSNFQARRELSVLLADNGFNEEALANLEYLTKYFPEDAELYYNLGILYEKLKNPQKAKDSYEKAISINPQDDFYYNLGEVLVSLEEWDEAITAFKQVLRNDTGDGNCYFNLGICYYHKDEKNFAIDSLRVAIEKNPKDIFAHFYLGNIYQEEGLTNFAEDCYKKVLEISPDYSWAYYNLASIAYQNGDIELAKEYLQKTIQYNDNDIDAYKLITKIYLKNNEIEEIITLINSRLNKEENGDLYYILAQVYKFAGKKEAYANALLNALENHLTLTFPKSAVKAESDIIEESLGRTKPEDSNSEENLYDDDYDETQEDEESDDDSEYDEEDNEDEYDEEDEDDKEDDEEYNDEDDEEDEES